MTLLRVNVTYTIPMHIIYEAVIRLWPFVKKSVTNGVMKNGEK